jgi:hypothetical protein
MGLASFWRCANRVSAFDYGLIAASIAFVAISALSAEAPPWRPATATQAGRAVSTGGSATPKQKPRRAAREVSSHGA